MTGSAPDQKGIFLGYLARKPWLPHGHWDPERKTGVVEACSVGDCMCERVPEWEKRWDFNRATCQETAALARAAIPPEEGETFRVFAYWLVPGEGVAPDQLVETILDGTLPPLPASPGPHGFEHLGFDVVGMGPFLPPFDHSPLSCNHEAERVPVNRWCLIDELGRARALARSWSEANGVGVEPGTYYVVRVAREPSGTTTARASTE